MDLVFLFIQDMNKNVKTKTYKLNFKEYIK